jgi:23S rRNA (uracil1939-C5)-methyltransferase
MAKMGDGPVFDVTLDALVYGGDALGRLPDGRAVFVPYALPGERVRIRLVEEKRGHARAELVELLQPSSQRILPRCPHFGACGGCHYQHLSYPAQLQAKTEILKETFVRVGGLSDPPVHEAIGSPQEWYYRNHIQFHLTEDAKLGFLARDSHTVVPIRECYLPEEALNSLWPLLDLEPIPGLTQVGLRSGAGEDILLVLEGSDPQAPEFSVDLPLSAVYVGPDGPLVLAGDEAIVIEVLGRPFQVSAESFFQVNTLQAGAMVQHLLANLPLSPSSIVLEVYCGAGLFSAFIAGQVKRLVGVELSQTACADFATNLDEFVNVELYEGSAEEILPSLTIKPDIVVVDPPRAGLDRRVLDAILGMEPSNLAYVSCDPATLARDARRLVSAGYRLENVTPFDLFPQTLHIESISLFRHSRK